MEFEHTDKNGNVTKLKDLGTKHLKNIIAYIERRAKEGITVGFGGSGCHAEDMWYDEETYYGERAKQEMDYEEYIEELKRRNINLYSA